MPTPPAGKAFTLAKANPYEHTSVKDKIKKWQTDGGGVLQEAVAVADSDKESKSGGSGSGSGGSSSSISGVSGNSKKKHAKAKSESQLEVVVIEEPESVVEDGGNAPKTPSQLSASNLAKLPMSAPRIIERRPQANLLDEDVRDAVKPKKRIISDGHWKRKHIDPNAKPTSPPKPAPKKKEQYGWVRPPMLPRAHHDGDESPPKSPEKKVPVEERPMKVYTGKGKTKPIVTQIHSQLAMRPKDSVPIPTPPTPKTPKATPRPRRQSETKPAPTLKWSWSGESSAPKPPKIVERRPRSMPEDDELEPPRTARSNPTQTVRERSRAYESAYLSHDETPRKRLSKSRKTESEGYKSEVPVRRRSKSVGAPPLLQRERRPYRLTSNDTEVRLESANETRQRAGRRNSVQKSPVEYESAGEERQRRRRRSTRRRVSDESKTSHEDFPPPTPPRELNNYDEEAEKRRSDFRAEFKQFTPTREKKSHRRSRTKRFSYSPEGIDRIPEPSRDEPVREPDPPQRQTSHRIEAWLGETPDPFREEKKSNSRRSFSFEKGAPRKQAKAASTVYTETTITDTTITDSTITDSTITDLTESTIAPKKYGHDRNASRNKRSPNDRKARASSEPSSHLDPGTEVEHSSTTSVPTLKRAGARRGTSSPTNEKRRSKPARTVSSYTENTDYTETDITSSIVSSSIDPRDFSKPGEQQQPYSVARRLFPSTGKRLSTIVSVETLATKDQNAPQPPLPVTQEGLSSGMETAKVTKAQPTEDSLAPLPIINDNASVISTRSRSSLKRKLTTHKDLMTVLSMPESKRAGSVISARSIRTHRSRLETATIEDLMKEMASDELKYMRELRTLADGVIPILLKSVLSKSSAADAAGLFGRVPGMTDKEAIAEASKVIHELSVAIQRLKSLHARCPKENHFSLLIWAQSAQSVYEKYIKTWRLGFQDVVVSLASQDDTSSSVLSATKTVSEDAWDQMPRNEEGYIINSDGERVDVAFLLKRPLVRLKYLTKTLKGVNAKKPSEQAGVLARKFEQLMEKARKKVDEEKGRMEDEAAAGIDATRARDPKSLAPLAGVKIDATRNVRARDYFDCHLPHSSGQTVDCRVEVLVRDDAPGRGSGGDFLICEVDESDRWLLFPPVEFKRISARAGDEAGEIVVLLRGLASGGEEWDEVFTLSTTDEEVRFEWIQWMGLQPVPPVVPTGGVKRRNERPVSSHGGSSLLSTARTESTAPVMQKSRTPSPREVEIPIGERAGHGSKRWSRDVTSPKLNNGSERSETSSFVSSVDSERAMLEGKREYSDVGTYSSISSSYVSSYISHDDRRDRAMPASNERPRSRDKTTTPRNLNEAMAMAGDAGSPTMKRSRATRYHSSPVKKSYPEPLQEQLPKPVTTSAQFNAKQDMPKKKRSIKKTNHAGGFSVWIPNSADPTDDSDSDYSDEESLQSSYLSGRPPLHHRTSSVPSLKLPTVGKQRSSRKDDDFMMSGALVPEPLKTSSGSPTTSALPQPLKTPSRYRAHGKEPSSAPPRIEKRHERAQSAPISPAPQSPVEDKPPPPPPHRTPSSQKVNLATTPQFTPNSQIKRRSSSPLKHEYRPSSPSSESSYTEEDSLSEYSEESLTSESEDEFDNDVASTFVPSVVTPTQQKEVDRPTDIYSLPNGTIKPSESASQAPYRHVPQAVTVESKPNKCVATIFTWSDKGAWELLHPSDCSIVITPGLIAAYQMSASHETQGLPEERPLVAQELTPLVPLRRGTALDITIRSPPTAASKLKPGSNIMFRSRSGEECELLYNLINRARINNPTYIALQNARPTTGGGWAAAMDKQNSLRVNNESDSNGGFFSAISRSKSYRSKSRAQSTAGNTESSIGTISSVITAMKRFSGANILNKATGGSRMSFSRDGSDSLGSGGSGTHSPPQYLPPGSQALGAGISNAKIRLYVLQSKNKWADLGSAKLSILPKEEGAEIKAPIMLHTGVEKRIVIVKGKKKEREEKLLDVTLPEPCFERWARTGIGVSVWVDASREGGVGETGGVSEKRVVKYMIQLKSERECAYTFSLLGKLRY